MVLGSPLVGLLSGVFRPLCLIVVLFVLLFCCSASLLLLLETPDYTASTLLCLLSASLSPFLLSLADAVALSVCLGFFIGVRLFRLFSLVAGVAVCFESVLWWVCVGGSSFFRSSAC